MQQVATIPRAQPVLVDDVAGLARAYEDSQAFVSLLAHELRTKLTVIEFSLRMDDEEAKRAALEGAHSMQELVEGLLELARGRDGDADASSATRNVVDELDAPEVDVLVEELPVVPLPRVLLETVLRNLIANAVEAGADRIEVFARLDGTICVRDDGAGVPAAKAERIFDVYTSKFGGAGMGLTLCREIVRRRGGDIWLEPPSTFCFRAG